MPPALHRCIVACLLTLSSGCALTNQTPTLPGLEAPEVSPAGGLEPNQAAQTFQKIKQAKRENAVILQVSGDPEPLRVLPLPGEGQAVFVSDLLTQTGVFRKFGRVEAELFRDSTSLMDGVRMRVEIRGNKITPGTDYALRPGDRLVVRQATAANLGSALDGIIPANAMRGMRGVFGLPR